jgi:DNA invertase Pin-like site-specific DNA recombinase
MQRQTGTTAALYYRVANRQSAGVYLDNQMQQLLCYAQEQEFDGFTLYADIGKSGITLDRPALNALKADIEAGRADKVIVYNTDRLCRDIALALSFVAWARSHGAEVISVLDGCMTDSLCAELAALCARLPRGGGRV